MWPIWSQAGMRSEAASAEHQGLFVDLRRGLVVGSFSKRESGRIGEGMSDGAMDLALLPALDLRR